MEAMAIAAELWLLRARQWHLSTAEHDKAAQSLEPAIQELEEKIISMGSI